MTRQEATLSAADPASEVTASGRGLFLVDALAVKWGFEQTPGGRRVWAILATIATGQPRGLPPTPS